MRVLVTGATGFLGRALRPRLEASGWEVLPFSRAQGDLEADPLPTALPARADAAVHLASTSPAALERLLAWARVAGVRVFVLASSGNAKAPPPEDPYGRWKALGEKALLEAGLPRAVALRFHTLFGKGEHPDRLLPRLRAATGPVEVAAPDGVRLTPTHVDDAAEAVARCLEADRASGVFDVAGPEILTVGEIARRLGKTVTPRPPRPGERDLAGDPAPLKAALGWAPSGRLPT